MDNSLWRPVRTGMAAAKHFSVPCPGPKAIWKQNQIQIQDYSLVMKLFPGTILPENPTNTSSGLVQRSCSGFPGSSWDQQGSQMWRVPEVQQKLSVGQEPSLAELSSDSAFDALFLTFFHVLFFLSVFFLGKVSKKVIQLFWKRW